MIRSSFHTWGCLGSDILSSGNLFGDVSQHTDNVLGNLFSTALNNRWWNRKGQCFQQRQRPSKFCFISIWGISFLWLGFVWFFKLPCFASLCFIELRDERCGLEFSGDICPSLDTGLLAWFSCMWIACGRGGDGRAASSLLVLFQRRFCTDPSAPCKAQSWLSNGVHKGSSWPATLGGSLTLCRDMLLLLTTKTVESEGGKARREMPAATVLLYSLQRVGQMKFMWLLVGFYLCTTK